MKTGVTRASVARTCAMALVLTSLLLPSAGADELVRVATKDTFIASGNPNNSAHGGWSLMYLGQHPSDLIEHLLVGGFDLSPIAANATVNSATLTLRLYITDPSDSIGYVRVRRATGAWAETATWNNSASLMGSTIYSQGFVGPTYATYAFDVTALVQQWVSGSLPNHGFYIDFATPGSANADELAFGTRESSGSSNHPRLTISYTGPSSPDLIVPSLSVSDPTLYTNQPLTINATVKNQGTAVSASTTLRYYRSNDSTISTGDTSIGTDPVSGLSPNATSSESISNILIPAPGTYWVGACVDVVSGETATGNNCSNGVMVVVAPAPPDINVVPEVLVFTQDTARPIYVEIDWMETGTHSHRPSSAVINRIEDVFAAAGYSINIEVSNQIPHDDAIAVTTNPSNSPEVQAIMASNFDHIDDGRYFYSIWGHNYSLNGTVDGSSGYADLPGRVHLVTLGSFPGSTGTFEHQVGTFIHELGHNLSLRHGGFQDANYKPNYVSVMNYYYQLSGVGPALLAQGFATTSSWHENFSYSHGLMPDLNENNLDETFGIGLGRSVDWNCDSTLSQSLAKDIQQFVPPQTYCDATGARSILEDFDDWSAISGQIPSSKSYQHDPGIAERCIGPEEHRAFFEQQRQQRIDSDGPGESSQPDVTSLRQPKASEGGQKFTIQNLGASTLSVTGIALDQFGPWIEWSSPALPFHVGPGASQDVLVFVDYNAAPPETTVRRLRINSNDPDENPYPTGVDVWVQGLSECTLTTAVTPTAGGDTTGDATVACGSSVIAKAFPSIGYQFVRWTENGAEVSTLAQYAFTLGQDRDLVAHFAVECQPSDCDDDNPCTDDSCNPVTGGCNNAPNMSPCDDGTACTTADTCAGGVCAGEVVTCEDGNACTDDTCDPVTGQCRHDPNSSTCDDGNACTTNDICSGGACIGDASDCEDGNPCTDDVCDPATGQCSNEPNVAACDDGNPCTISDSCSGGVCAGETNDCEDGNACTDDSCDPVTGQCSSEPNTSSCDDGNACTTSDTCLNGTCAGVATDCQDGNLCTDDSCDPATGQCVNAPNTGSCEDGAFCTVGDTCNGSGLCLGGAPRDCGDGDVCTDDDCDEEMNSCTNVFDITNDPSCETCGDGIVQPGEQCDDGNVVPGDGCENDCTLTPGLDHDNDGLTASDPCPTQPLNECFGPVAVDDGSQRRIRINTDSVSTSAAACGGSKTDCRGKLWIEDYGMPGFVTGYNQALDAEVCSLPNNCDTDATNVFGCTDAQTEHLFQCGHWDPAGGAELEYFFDLPEGAYLVNLLFMNTFAQTANPGDRVFSVQLNGTIPPQLLDFDQVAAAGGKCDPLVAPCTPVVRSALVNVAGSGGLRIRFLGNVARPAIKGIEVLRQCDGNIQFDRATAAGPLYPTAANGLTVSYDHTMQDGNLLVVFAKGLSGSGQSAADCVPTLVSYAGMPLTHHVNDGLTITDATQVSTHVALWYLVNPALGSNSVEITYPAECASVKSTALSLTGVDPVNPRVTSSSTPVDLVGAAGTDSILTSVAGVRPGDWLVDVFHWPGNKVASTTESNQLGRVENRITPGGSIASSTKQADSTSETMGWMLDAPYTFVHGGQLVGVFAACSAASCGDGTISQPEETCDPPGFPAGASQNICRSDCTVCGDGVEDPVEDCDDGNSTPSDGCENDCRFSVSCTDQDGDGYGSPGTISCPEGPEDDCNDTTASIHPGAAEKCDGLDNDCDGAADEPFTGIGDACIAGDGECRRTGQVICTADGFSTECDAVAGDPVAESCDGLDNDCDGDSDEDFPGVGDVCVVGIGECERSGHKVCDTAGTATVCDAQPGDPTNEACGDGLDNDCNGLIDENCECKGLALDLAWNMVGVAVDVGYDAQAVCMYFETVGCGPVEIVRFINGGWESHVCGLPFNNFDLLPGAAYFVRIGQECAWCQEGVAIPSPLTLQLDTGWNDISLPDWAEIQAAEDVCAEIHSQGGSPVEIDRFVNGGWESHVCGLPFNNFAVVPGAGYFVRVTGPSLWTIARGVRITNVTDISLSVSWTTEDPQNCVVHYGATASLDQTAEDDRGASTLDDTHHVTLSGLTPATSYLLDLECDGVRDDNGGAHYTAGTGPTLGIPSPDTAYGAVFLSDGSTPAVGTIVYVELEDGDGVGSPSRSTSLSDVVASSDGGLWDVDLGSARLQDLGGYFAYTTPGDLIVLAADGAASGTASQIVTTGDGTPSPPMTLQPGGSRHPQPAPPSADAKAAPDEGETGGSVVVEGPYFANVTDTAFTVVWVTDRQVGARVHVTPIDRGSPRSSRDVSTHETSRLHMTTVGGLAPDTTYEVRIDHESSESWLVQTGPTLQIPESATLWGRGDDHAPDGIVFIRLIGKDGSGSSPLAARIEDGVWGTNLGNLRRSDLESFDLPRSGATIEIRVLTDESGSGSTRPMPATLFELQRDPARPGTFKLSSEADSLIKPHTDNAPRVSSLSSRPPIPTIAGESGVDQVCPGRVVNLRDVAFTVTWGTEQPTGGYVNYGLDPGDLSGVACDIRDDGFPCDYVADTHFVPVTGLVPSTTYYAQLVTAGHPLAEILVVETGPTLPIPPSDTVYGQALHDDGSTYAEGAYVCVTVGDADGSGSPANGTDECDLVGPGDSGYWSVNLGNSRTTDLSGRFQFSASGDEVSQRVCGALRGCASQVVDTAADSPSPAMRLEQVCDCRPVEVGHLWLDKSSPMITWTDLGGGVGYGLVGGVLSEMRSDLNILGAACLASTPQTGWDDLRPALALGDGYYYLVHASNACGSGTYGAASSGTDRPAVACP